MLAVTVGAKRMKLIGKNQESVAFLKEIVCFFNGYRHFSAWYGNQLKACVQMQGKGEISSALNFEKVAVQRMFGFVKHVGSPWQKG